MYRKVGMFLLNKFTFILLILISISCSSLVSTSLTRSPSSKKNCLDGLDKIFELANNNFFIYLNKEETLKVSNDYLPTTSVLDEKGISYKFVRLFNKEESYFALEIGEEGGHSISKYLRRVRAINSDIKFYFSNEIGEDEIAAYLPSIESILLGEKFIKFIKNDLDEEFITTLSHEMRHAQFDKYLKESGRNFYAGVFLRVAGEAKNDYYDDILSLDESYTYMKDAQTIWARIKRIKRLGKSTIDLKETLEFRIFLGKKVTNQMLNHLKDFLPQIPKVLIDTTSNGSFLSYSYLLKNREKEFLFSIKKIDEDNFSLSSDEEVVLKLKASSVLQKQIDLLESNLKILNSLEKEIQ